MELLITLACAAIFLGILYYFGRDVNKGLKVEQEAPVEKKEKNLSKREVDKRKEELRNSLDSLDSFE